MRILQVGSNEGQSAAAWGEELKKNNGLLVCFDTWVGDLAMQLSETWREVMGWQVRPCPLSRSMIRTCKRICKRRACKCMCPSAPQII